VIRSPSTQTFPDSAVRQWTLVRALLLAFVLAAAVVPEGNVGAQPSGATVRLTGRIAGSDTLIVSVLTMGQGAELFDRFGHMSIRVQNLATGLDSAWNWGMYDFDSPGFIARFLTGETRYWMAGYPTGNVLGYYRYNRRAVWEQRLDLGPREADSLLALLRRTSRDENKFYRYDYYLDNCATRVRDALDSVLGGALKRTLSGPGQGLTWRHETLRLAADFPVIGFAMSFALGPRADAPMSAWDELFIPMRLRDALRGVRVTQGAGGRPLVLAERLLVPEGAFTEAAAAPSFVGWGLGAGIAIAIVVLLLGNAARTSVAARAALGALGFGWHLTAGLCGTLVLLAGLVTRHLFMGANTGVLLGTPVSLVLAGLMFIVWSRRTSPRTLRAAALLAAFTSAAAALALFSHVTPSFAPADLSAVALALPVHAAFAYVLRLRAASVTT
jgi:hypothetical protein